MCANPNLDVAMDACCKNPNVSQPYGTHLCKFDAERTTYSRAQSRCQTETGGNTCDWYGIEGNSNTCTRFSLEENWHWTNKDCLMKVKGK